MRNAVIELAARTGETRVSGVIWSSSGSATESRTVDGPSTGHTMYAPGPRPQRPSVWPKSSLCRSSPISLATSARPSRPNTEFEPKRIRSLSPSVMRPCMNRLAADQTSKMLLKKLVVAVRTGPGTTFL
jgi:hypothetical protein